jgi:hypothetical protein
VARRLAGVDIAALDDGLGRRAGLLPARSGLADAIDAAVVSLAADGDDILTSDPSDLRALARAQQRRSSASARKASRRSRSKSLVRSGRPVIPAIASANQSMPGGVLSAAMASQ